VARPGLASQLAEIAGTYDIKGIGYDTWRIEELLTIMTEEGLDQLIEIMTPFRQDFVSMNGPMDRLEQLVLDRELVHGSNPILTDGRGIELPAGARSGRAEKAMQGEGARPD
jgi:phage terminase large subunit-like protein